MLIEWNGSICPRESGTMVKGGQYETDDLRPPIGQETLDEWIATGVAIPVEDSKAVEADAAKVEPVVVPETVETSDAEEDITDNDKINKLEDDEEPEETNIPEPTTTEEPEVLKIEVATESYLCPEIKNGCDKDDPYSTFGGFKRHMNTKHGQKWEIEGDFIVKKD